MRNIVRILACKFMAGLIKPEQLDCEVEVVYFNCPDTEFLEKIACVQPDVVFMEMFMPNIDAIDIINSYSALYASSKPCFAVISQFMSARLKNDLKNCGVGAILTKSSSAREVADIIMRVYKNKLSGSSHKSKDGISIVHAVHRTKPNAELENTVAEILCELGIPNHVPGYQYLKCAIALAVQDETMMHSVTRMLYPAIAEEFNATPSRVERRIRHAIIVAWERGDSSVIELYFGCTIDNMRGKPANSEFIAMVADRIRLNMRHAENYAAV